MGSIKISKNKKILYTTIVVISICLWIVAYIVTNKATNKSAKALLHEWNMNTSMHVQSNVYNYVRELDQLQRSNYEVGVNNIDEAIKHVRSLNSKYSGHQLAVVDSQGTIFDLSGKTNSSVYGKSTVNRAKSQGYSLGSIVNGGSKDIILLLPLDSNEEFFVGEIISPYSFSKIVFEGVHFSAEYADVRDEYGNVIVTLGEDTRAKGVKNEYARAFKKFNSENNDVIRVDFYGSAYNIFINMEEPQGWFISSYSLVGEIVPIYSQLQVIIFSCSIIWFLLAAAIIFFDIRNDLEKKREMVRASLIDGLTGLYNSNGMQEKNEAYFIKNPDQKLCFVCLDILSFHRFNSMFGYSNGDRLLKIVSDVIKKEYHCGVRINSDVFSLIAPFSDDVDLELQDKLYNAIRYKMGEQYIQMIVFKFGIYPVENNLKYNFRETYDGALLALKEAKNTAIDRGVFYDENMQRIVDMQKIIEMSMMNALNSNEFLVYIQPKSELLSGECIGGEALVRWQSDDLGMIGPMDFIPLFEKNGFIVELDFYMLEKVMAILEDEFIHGDKMTTISVNQSRITIRYPDYIERLKNTLANYTFPLKFLEIEITESVLETDYNDVITLMNQLKELGLSVSMDDFGSGYSSLNALRELPVDILKMDKEFLVGGSNSARGKQIIVSVIHMAKAIGIKVICEGVETQSEYDFLSMAGCDYMQGFYYARPMPYLEFKKKYLE